MSFASELRADIERHPSTHHLFLSRCATSPFAREDFAVLAEHLYPLACVAPGPDGERDRAQFARFVRACGADVDLQARVPAPALDFLVERRRIGGESPLARRGAEAVAAWAVPTMFGAIAEGLRRAGFDEGDMAYFTRLVGDAALEEALAGASPEARTHIRRGAARSLDAYGRLWSGVQRAIVRFRQPHAVRFDGREPRGAVHELLLTAWDSVPLLRAVEARGDALRARLRPTVGDLLGRR